MNAPKPAGGLRELVIAQVESAKLAGFNAKELRYDGRDGGLSNQMEGYYDSADAVDAIVSGKQVIRAVSFIK